MANGDAIILPLLVVTGVGVATAAATAGVSTGISVCTAAATAVGSEAIGFGVVAGAARMAATSVPSGPIMANKVSTAAVSPT